MFKNSFGAVFGVGTALIATLAVAGLVVGGGVLAFDHVSAGTESKKDAIADRQYICALLQSGLGPDGEEQNSVAEVGPDQLNEIEFDEQRVALLRELMFRQGARESEPIQQALRFCSRFPQLTSAERYAIEVRRRQSRSVGN